jgi:hypothetical protein
MMRSNIMTIFDVVCFNGTDLQEQLDCILVELIEEMTCQEMENRFNKKYLRYMVFFPRDVHHHAWVTSKTGWALE